jgi:hypothetical protein
MLMSSVLYQPGCPPIIVMSDLSKTESFGQIEKECSLLACKP